MKSILEGKVEGKTIRVTLMGGQQKEMDWFHFGRVHYDNKEHSNFEDYCSQSFLARQHKMILVIYFYPLCLNFKYINKHEYVSRYRKKKQWRIMRDCLVHNKRLR